MKWEDILKVDVNMKDARRLGRNYAIEDMYEARLISEEEYDRLSEEDKFRYHARVATFLSNAKKRGVSVPEKNLKFHRAMFGRIQRKSKVPTRANFYEGYRERAVNPLNPLQVRAKAKPKEILPRTKPVPTLILDYFKMYRDRGLGIPTVEDISREEGRPLTVEELEGYSQYRRGRKL